MRSVDACIIAIAAMPTAALAQATITAPNNQGIITQGQNGSNYLLQKPPARHLSASTLNQILAQIPRDKPVQVDALNGVEDAFDLAVKLHAFLAENGYDVGKSASTALTGG